jgi:molecular chaperone DnaK (HSP70)
MYIIIAASNSEVVPHLLIRTASQRRKGKSIHKANLKEGLNGVGLQKMLTDAKENPVRFALPPGVVVPEEQKDDDDDEKKERNIMDDDKMLVNTPSVSPEFLSCQVLKKLFQTAEEETGEKITRAVIGVPAYFNDMQREATIKAACMASGIPPERIRLLREPEAAALAYGIGKQQIGKGDEEELVLVFDLGGGTFDVSILEVGGGIYEVVATGGNNMLGGSDFDARIAQHFSKKMMEHGCTKNYWNEGGDVAEKMVTSAEQVRIALSNNREVTVALPLTDHEWLSMTNPRDVIVKENNIEDVKTSDSTHAIFNFSRKSMETLCLDIFLALLRPVREVAILGGAMLPGDTNPSAVEAVLQMEEELEMELARNAGTFENFFDEESGEAKADPDDDISEATLLQLKNYDLKDRKKMQQRGRKRARNLQKDEQKFRQEKRKAGENAKNTSQNVKVRDGINGRRLTQIILVGGATRMPAIGRLLAAVTGVVPQKTVNPDECVALGCAVQVGILDGINTELQVLSPIEAAMMRALAKKRGVTVDFDDGDDFEEGYVEEYF